MTVQVFYAGWGVVTGWGIFPAPEIGSLSHIIGIMHMVWGGSCFIFLVISGCCPAILKESKNLQRVSILLCFSFFITSIAAFSTPTTINLRILFGSILFSSLFSCVVAFGVATAWMAFFDNKVKSSGA